MKRIEIVVSLSMFLFVMQLGEDTFADPIFSSDIYYQNSVYGGSFIQADPEVYNDSGHVGGTVSPQGNLIATSGNSYTVSGSTAGNFASSYAHGEYYARVAPGGIHMSMSGHVFSTVSQYAVNGPDPIVGLSVQGEWLDYGMVSAGGFEGEQVVVHSRLFLEGTVNAEVTGDYVSERIGATSLIQVGVKGEGSSKPGPSTLLPQTNLFATAFDSSSHNASFNLNASGIEINVDTVMTEGELDAFGVEMTMAGQTTAKAESFPPPGENTTPQLGTAEAEFGADFNDTLYWGGITSINTIDGDPITDWSFTSASGIDYTQAVPEPASPALAALALSALLAKRRRS